MYKNRKEWTRLHELINSGSQTIRGLARETGIGRDTLRKIGKCTAPQPYRLGKRRASKLDPHRLEIKRLLLRSYADLASPPISAAIVYRCLQAEYGYKGGYSIVRDYVKNLIAKDDCVRSSFENANKLKNKETSRSLLRNLDQKHAFPGARGSSVQKSKAIAWLPSERTPGLRDLRRSFDREWMRSVIQKDIDQTNFLTQMEGCRDLDELIRYQRVAKLFDRNKAMVIISRYRGIPARTSFNFLGINKGTYYRYLYKYREGGITGLFGRKLNPNRKFDNEDIKEAVFRVLHEPPSQYGINRTSWIMPDLSRVLGDLGLPAGRDVIRRITKKAGYKWRKARVQLTSQDPAYREKLAAVQAILSNLAPDEAFFSIDEFGPFAVKIKQGLMLDPPGPHRVVPQWQKSKGCLIMTAALELSGNQVTHFYSDRKNTTEMIRMMDVLLDRYADRRTLYLSWDAASWHISKKLKKRIEEHNDTAEAAGHPRVETAPLPAGAQFLNVIESVFSGMARAIIHNSNYPSTDAVRAAIDRYFAERNQQFRDNPKRAGKRIWGNERVPPVFSDSNNCKDPRWR
jgi:transposase